MSEEKVRRESSHETPGSTLEQEVWIAWSEGKTPNEIAQETGLQIKVVFRSIQRLQKEIIGEGQIKNLTDVENSVSLDTSQNDDDEQPIMELRDPARGPEMDAEIKIDNEKLLRTLESHCADLTKREKSLLVLYLQGLSNDQIARAWRENVKIIRVEMNALMAKLRYRLLSAKTAEILGAAAVAYERIARDQEEIEQLKTETRALLAGLRAA